MRLMKQTLLILVLFILSGYTLHIETVVEYEIHSNNNSLFVAVKMEKSYASILLMNKGESITPNNRKAQLNKVIRENTHFKINDISHKLKFQSATSNEKMIQLNYYVENIPSRVSSFVMENDVIVGIDDEAIVNAYVNIKNEKRKVLRFSKKTKSLTVNFK